MSPKDTILYASPVPELILSPAENLPLLLINTQVTQIQSSFRHILEGIEQNKNVFAKTANYLGELASWKKIMGGVVLAVPPFATGIAIHVSVILALSAFITVGYTAGSLVLDEYHRCNKQMLDKLKGNLFSLATILGATITALETIRKNFEGESQKFKAQNELLATEVDLLQTEMKTLTETEAC